MQWNFGRALLLFGLTSAAVFAADTDNNKATIEAGHKLFLQKCAFCHGRDARGGETGPDLTASTLVKSDENGNKIGFVIRNGRPEKGMPKFALPDDDIASLVAFVHKQVDVAAKSAGQRKGVSPSDLQSGNAEAGKKYFEGAGQCSSCHSATGDLAHVASKYPPLKLELRMLSPEDAPIQGVITLPSGEKVSGKVAYADEFTIGVRGEDGTYRSFRRSAVSTKIDDPTDHHWELLSKYTDDDVHNLIAYLQTLK